MSLELRNEAQHLAVDLGWYVLPVKPHAKEPLTRNGVKDATNDERAILHYWERWPDANIGIATGAPGPTVLDVDDPQAAAFALAGLENAQTPESATARGRHLFYAGSESATVRLAYGELRGVGSYVVVPPSVHPSGKAYVWLVEPRSRALPPVPASLVSEATSTAGVGVVPERAGRVPHGERHDYLKDAAVRFVRGGITDVHRLADLLRADYEAHCELEPPARADEFRKLAEWASSTRMAHRERMRAEHAEREGTGAAVEVPSFDVPSANASDAEHRAFIARCAGLPANVEVAEVRRFGSRLVDGMEVRLSTGVVIDFARQADAVARGGWQRAVISATDGAAKPLVGLKEPQLIELLRSLCIVANTSRTLAEAETHAEMLREFLALCEPLIGFTLASSAARFELIETLRDRDRFDPFDRSSLATPVRIIDEHGGAEYLRGGELWDFYRHKGAGISTGGFPGRMAMAGLEHVAVNGREPMPLDPSRKRRVWKATLYRLAGDRDA